MLKYGKWFFALVALFALRLVCGLWFPPVQPMTDEIQVTLVGMKYYTTGAWPYYGNDIVAPPECVVWIDQDPGPLMAFLVGGPWKFWPSPLAPFFLVNLFSMAGFSLLAFYACKRLPGLPPWFVFPWILTAPWCLHYSTSMLNFSYTIAFACLFFVAFLESLPSLSLRWIPAARANALMGLVFSAWVQLHRTWVLILPLLLLSFFLQWKSTRRWRAPLFFILGGLPLFALMVPTFLQPHFGLSQNVNDFSIAWSAYNFRSFFTTLVQFFAMACFEMPRFIGQHTVERFHFLSSHWLLVPGVFLWYFGFLQILILIYFLFHRRTGRPDWDPVRFLTAFLFLFLYVCFLFTMKHANINTFCELLPMVMLYSLYVWDYWWKRPWGRMVLWFALACSLIFQPALAWIRLPEKESFYLKYGDAMSRAIAQRNYHLLGERRPGAYY